MSDDRARYLASSSEPEPPDHERLDLIREILRSESIWAEPPSGVGESLLAEIGVAQSTTSPVTVTRWPWIVAGVAILAVVVGIAATLVGGGGEVVVLHGTDLMEAASGEATVRPSGSGWFIELELDDLPAASEGTYYEGWVWSDDGDGVSIGTFHLRGGDEKVLLWSGVDPDDYPSIWVTLEEEDGDATASDAVLLRGRPEDDT